MNTRKEKLLIPAIAFIMILLFAVLCAAGAFALSTTAEKEDSFERLDYVDESLVTGSIGTLQEAALRRLNAANEEEGGKLTLFSDTQLAKFKAARENGTLEPLSLEDIRFLINDSIVLYNKYDEIVIKRIQDAAPSEEDEVIVPYHGEFGNEYSEETDEILKNMEKDIFRIVVYRLSVLDGGLFSYQISDSSYDNEQLICIHSFAASAEFDRESAFSEYKATLLALSENDYKKPCGNILVIDLNKQEIKYIDTTLWVKNMFAAISLRVFVQKSSEPLPTVTPTGTPTETPTESL